MTRDKLYQRFGVKLIEAIVLIIKDEINILRNKAGLPERTNQQIIDAIANKLVDSEGNEKISDYDWMKEF